MLALVLALPIRLDAQRFSPAQREVWASVESRWHAWQTNNLVRMLALHDARFHRWNPRTGRLQDRDSLLPQWRMMKRFEHLDSLSLQPVAIDLFGDFAAVHYISRETVRPTSEAPPVVAGQAKADEAVVVRIRWSDYVIKDHGRWLYIGGARINCSSLEAGSSCRGVE